MAFQSKELVEIACFIKVLTDRAALIFDGKDEVWVPLSQIDNPEDLEQGIDTTIEIPEWLAKDKGLI